MEQLSRHVLDFIDHAGYSGLFVIMVLGNMGLPVGTEIVVPAAGALAATGHLSSVWLAALVATAGEVVGGSALYAIGWFGGRPFVLRYGRYVKLTETKYARWHEFYGRYGNALVFVCRFLPFVRGVSALPAGVSRMSRRFFLTYTTLGSLIFCFALAYLGAAMGHHTGDLMTVVHRSALAIVAVVVVAIVAFIVYRMVEARRRTV